MIIYTYSTSTSYRFLPGRGLPSSFSSTGAGQSTTLRRREVAAAAATGGAGGQAVHPPNRRS